MSNRSLAAARRSSLPVTLAVASVEISVGPGVVESLEVRRFMSVALPKLGGVLEFLANDFSARPAASQSRSVIRGKAYTLGAAQPNASLLETNGDTVLVKAASKTAGTSALAAQFAALGASVTGRYGRVLTAFVPVSALAKVESLSYLKFAKPSYKPIVRVGKTDDYGVQSLAASAGGKEYGVDGTGVTVGILSDSYNYLKTASTGVTNGDLPSNVNVVRDLLSTDNQGAGTDEGRGMAEIVHDVAPGAGIAFYTADLGEPSFAAGILTLAKPTANGGAGAKVVVDDVGYLDEPYFQDGVVAQAVNTAASSYGTSYFSAAGNSGRDSYESAFSPVTATVTGGGSGTYMDFDPSTATTAYQKITIPVGDSFVPSLQWDQPFYSASTNAGGTAGSANSLSMYLLDSTKSTVLTSETTNVTGGDPSQILEYDNPSTSSSTTFYLAIKVAAGVNPGLIKYIDDGSGTSTLQFATNSGTSVGHPVASGGLSVGAAEYDQTPAFRVSPAQLEYYSSSGGTPILFASNGTRLASPQVRNQPAITSVDGAATSFFGEQDITDYFKDGQFHFYGTSAAAPHAAAVAALMLQANPALTNTQVYGAMESTALDMDVAGYDYNTGYGLLQADRALAAVSASSISGVSFRDVNGNGVRDAGEPGLSATTVFLDANNNGLVDSGSGTVASTSSLAITDATAATNAPSRVTSSITSTLTGRVTKLTVSINATHTRVQQLGFTLVTPTGIRIPLLTTVGGQATTTATTGLGITLSDAATTAVQSLAAQTGTRTGTYAPQTALAAAIGESAAGTWQLEVRDYKSSNTGTLTSWSLGITYADPTTTTDSNGNYTFAGVTPSAFFGTYRVRAVTPAGFTPSGPASVYDLTIGRGTTTTGENFGAFAPVSTVAGIVLDDGTAQRSRVRGATVTFNGTIPAANVAAGAFTLTQTSGKVTPYTVSVTSVTTPAAGKTTVTLAFAGSAVVAGSVADGHYTLSVDGSKLIDSTGLAVDALSSGAPGSVATLTFGRIYGDIDGDGGISIADFNRFAAAFASTSDRPQYVDAFDYDGDSGISIADFNAFAGRFGQLVP